LTELPPGEIVHRWPQVLPGGKAVLFTAYPGVTGVNGAAIQVISTKDRRVKTLVPSGTWGRYLMSGHLIYLDHGALFAVPFDAGALEVRGTPVRVLDEIAYSAAFGCAQIDVSRTGTLVYRSSRTGQGLVTVEWVDRSERTRALLPVPGSYLSPTLSPDSTRLALTSAGDIWVYTMGRGSMTRLTAGGGYTNPVWSADGQYIVFRAGLDMLWTRATGTAQPNILSHSRNQQTPWSFSPDGKQLAFVEIDPDTGADIWTMPVESGPSGLRAGKPEVFLRTSFHERSPAFSPDGRWIAYMSNESGEYEVYVRGFPPGSGKWQVSPGRAGYAAWSRNRRELFYLGLDPTRLLMAVSYTASRDAFLPEPPRLFSRKIVHFGTTRSYDPAPDGKQVIALTAAEDMPRSHDRLEFLLNFFDELRRRAPITSN
jgi:serine/threonine-protein kinase